MFSNILFHFPHASTHIPSFEYFLKEKIESEINLLTDWATDKIFAVRDIHKVSADFSRVFCDVERLPDKDEVMYQKGMGIYYTHTDDGKLLRVEDKNHKQWVIDNFYTPHHKELFNKTKEIMEKYGSVMLIDCHSFSSSPLIREINQSLDRPDICIGTDHFHTPPELTKKIVTYFRSLGFSVKENMPYSGTIVPLELYEQDKRVLGFMIEINKKLYMDEQTFVVNEDSVKKLNSYVEELVKTIL